jgi:hypothetical protein
MLKYQIHKLSKGTKEARAVLLEDILTSDVFGLMTYLPYTLLFKTFLDQIELGNPESNFSAPTSEPIKIHFWKSYIWPESLPNLDRESIEPDVVIEWNDTLLIVEAKFISATDPEELLREYLIGHFEAKTDKQAFLLLIDKNLSPPCVNFNSKPTRLSIVEYIQERIADLHLSESYPPGKVRSSILWSNWQNFYVLVEILKNEILSGVNGHFGSTAGKILEDLLAILKRKGLEPFENFDLAEFNKHKVNLNSLGQIGRMMNDPIPFLSQFNLNNKILSDLLPPKR